MTRVPLTPNFFLDEFIDPSIYAERGARSRELLDYRIPIAAQAVYDACREDYGDSFHGLLINTWANSKRKVKRRESGLRQFNTRTGAKWSQHKYGRACDFQPLGITIQQLFNAIKKREKFFIERQLITTIENLKWTPTWLHIDCRFTGLDRFLIVDP